MRFATCTLLALSLLAFGAQAGFLHVHEYVEPHNHDHALAAHAHIPTAIHDAGVHIEAPDTAATMRLLSFTAVQPLAALTLAAPEPLAKVTSDRDPRGAPPPLLDPTAHGPPLTPAGLRAPPRLSLA
jgi:hypothetical protein